jgi:hypothetical protein
MSKSNVLNKALNKFEMRTSSNNSLVIAQQLTKNRLKNLSKIKPLFVWIIISFQ